MIIKVYIIISNSTYLSCTFHLKDDCFRSCPQCLCLSEFLWLAVFMTDVGPASVSLCTIITDVAAWTIDCTDQYSVILVCIHSVSFVLVPTTFWVTMSTYFDFHSWQCNVFSLKCNSTEVVQLLQFIVCLFTSVHLIWIFVLN